MPVELDGWVLGKQKPINDPCWLHICQWKLHTPSSHIHPSKYTLLPPNGGRYFYKLSAHSETRSPNTHQSDSIFAATHTWVVLRVGLQRKNIFHSVMVFSKMNRISKGRGWGAYKPLWRFALICLLYFLFNATFRAFWLCITVNAGLQESSDRLRTMWNTNFVTMCGRFMTLRKRNSM